MDPRTLRLWTVSSCRASGGDGEASTFLCFESAATPRAGHSVRCCTGVRSVLPRLDDQSLALCLDAAVGGGFVWLDPRDRQLWWVRTEAGPDGGWVRFVGCAGELGVGTAAGAGALAPDALMALRDRAAPRSAA